MDQRRVVVTGMGVISALGGDASEFWHALSQGRSGIGPIEAVDRTRLHCQNGAEVHSFDPRDHFERKQLRTLDRFAQFAVVAAREAVGGAGLQWSTALRERSAVIMGSCVGGQTTEDQVFRDLYEQGESRFHPFTIPRVMANAATSHVAMEFGLMGPAYTVSTACASANHAIGQAFWMVRHGMSDLALAGGSEAPFSLAHLKAWEAMRVMASDTCRPFSHHRKGIVFGEGGAVLVLEPLERALARSAPIHAEIVGFGMSSDAHHIAQPLAAGAARAMTQALENANVAPCQVGYVNAHGAGTTAGDTAEIRAIHDVFGSHARRLAVSSTKSMHGHALGATGALEAVATVLALRHGILPPTANFVEPDPACDLDVIPNQARAADIEIAMSNAFGFGGLNAVLVFRRWDR